MSNRSKVSNSNNTIECYALEIILENFTYEDVKRAKELDGLLGIHNPDLCCLILSGRISRKEEQQELERILKGVKL